MNQLILYRIVSIGKRMLEQYSSFIFISLGQTMDSETFFPKPLGDYPVSF